MHLFIICDRFLYLFQSGCLVFFYRSNLTSVDIIIYIKLLKIHVLFIYFYEFLNEFLNYRYIAAGVFSKCVPNSKGCCLDPVVYTRVASLHHWIRGKAPGVRDSAGCPKKIEVGIE